MLNTPPWAWGLIVGFPLIAWMLLENVVRLRRNLVPKVIADFLKDVGGVVRTREDLFEVAGPGVLKKAGSAEAFYVRGKVQCTSAVGPKICAAFITRISKATSGPTQGQIAKLYDSIQLPWSNIGVGELPIHPSIPRHFDVVKSRADVNKLEICGAMPYTMDGFLVDVGEYLIDIQVLADGIATPLQIKVTWTGKWDELRADKV